MGIDIDKVQFDERDYCASGSGSKNACARSGSCWNGPASGQAPPL